jgi:hypothetical protein
MRNLDVSFGGFTIMCCASSCWRRVRTIWQVGTVTQQGIR